MSKTLQTQADIFAAKMRAIIEAARAEVVTAMEEFYSACDESDMASAELEVVENFTSMESPLGVLAEFFSPTEGEKFYEAIGL